MKNTSGYTQFLLVEAESKEQATKAADSAIDGLFESGDLREGDRGSVGEEVLHLSDVGEAKLRELNQERKELYKSYLASASRSANELGLANLADVPLAEEDKPCGTVDIDLYRAAEILGGWYTPRGIVYDTEGYSCGFTERRIAELMKEPEKWWLVEVAVG